MTKPPSTEDLTYAAFDPGFTGACAWITPANVVEAFDLPITGGTGKKREFDLAGIRDLFMAIPRPVHLSIEWPTTRPGEGSERCERFGRGKGILQTTAFLLGFHAHFVPPNLWKGRLGLPGKTESGANKTCAAYYDLYYPAYSHIIRGPRGGIKDGRMDAALIAHWQRTRTVSGMRDIVEQFGKDSDEAMVFLFNAGPKRKRRNCKGGIL